MKQTRQGDSVRELRLQRGCQSEGQEPGTWQEVTVAAGLFQHPAHDSEPRRHESGQYRCHQIGLPKADPSDDPEVFSSHFR